MNKKLSKILILCCALVLVVAQTACSGGTTDKTAGPAGLVTPKPTPEGLMGQITFSTYTSFENDASNFAFLQEFKMQYNGVEVIIDELPYDEYFATLDARVASGEIGDVFVVDDSRLASYAEQGYLHEINSYLDNLLDYETYEKLKPENILLPAAYQACFYQNRMYMVATEYDRQFVFLNYSLLEQAGVEAPSDKWTWEELITDVEALSRLADVTPLVMDYADYSVWGAFARSYGDYLLEVDETTGSAHLNLTHPAVAQGIQDLAELVKSGVISNRSLSSIQGTDLSSIGMLVVSRDDISRWNETLEGDVDYEWDYLHLPAWSRPGTDEKGNATNLVYRANGANTIGLAISSNADSALSEEDTENHYKMCAQLALFSLVESAATAYAGEGEVIPAHKGVNEQKFWREYPVSGKNSSVFSLHMELDFPAVMTAVMPVKAASEMDMGAVIDAYVNHTGTPDEAFEALMDDLQELQDISNANWRY